MECFKSLFLDHTKSLSSRHTNLAIIGRVFSDYRLSHSVNGMESDIRDIFSDHFELD